MTAVPGTGRSKVKRTVHPELRRVVREAQAQGWSPEVTKGGHIVLRHGGGAMVFMSGTSRYPAREVRNVRAELRRAMREAGGMIGIYTGPSWALPIADGGSARPR
jgi:predicted RNA binding protein YcfA (HicA-like mRNA interferase family)